MTGAVSFKTLVGNISVPLALDGFTDCNNFVTAFVSMTILGISGMSLVSRVGIMGFSVVKTLSY